MTTGSITGQRAAVNKRLISTAYYGVIMAATFTHFFTGQLKVIFLPRASSVYVFKLQPAQCKRLMGESH